MNIRAWLRAILCRHLTVTLTTTCTAVITDGGAFLPAVEVMCTACGELWHAGLDVGDALLKGLEAR